MSDLLLMRGGGLRSLIHTPGLVACYLPYLQVAQGLTGQTLIDYSTQGNHAQLGSTAGADTNDPTWGTNALTFGGDDYITCPELGTGDRTVFSVWNVNMETAGRYNAVFAHTNVRLFYDNVASPSLQLGIQDNSVADRYKIYPYSFATNPGYILTTARVASGSAWGLGISDVGTMEAMGYTLNAIGYGRLIGASLTTAFLLTGDVACHVVFNRVLSDGEASRVRTNIVTLMNGQGVTVA